MPYLNTIEVGSHIVDLKVSSDAKLVLYTLLHQTLDEMEWYENPAYEDPGAPAKEPEELGWRSMAPVDYYLNASGLDFGYFMQVFQELVSGGYIEAEVVDPAGFAQVFPRRIMFFPDIQRRPVPGITEEVAPAPMVEPVGPPKVTARPGYVYLLSTEHGHYKIGRTVNPEARQKQLGILLPFTVQLVCLLATQDMVATERQLHEQFRHRHLNGEWFALTDEERDEIAAMAAK